MAPRTYISPRRATSAAATKEAVLDAAELLFSKNGYALTSLAEIARVASVAVNTVYVSVGGKPEIVVALIKRSLGGRIEHWESAQPPPESHDGRAIVATLVRNVRITFEPSMTVLQVMREVARADKNIRAEAELSRSRYRSIIQRVGERLSKLGLLRLGADAELAGDVLWFFLNVDAWQALQESGWSWDRSEEWLISQTCMALFGDESS